MDQLSLRATGLTKPPSNKAYLYNLLVTEVKKSPLLNREMLNHLLISASAQAEFRINKRVRDLQSCIREQGGHDKLFNKIEQINNTYARTLCYRSITNELIKLSLLAKYATNSVLPPAHTAAPPSSYASVLPVSPIALSGSPPAAEFSQPSPFIESLFSDPVWPYTPSDSFSTLEEIDMASIFIGSLFNDPAWPDIPSDSFSTLDELDTSFTFIESLFNDLISPNFYTSVDNSSPLSEPFTPAPNGFLDPLSQLPLSPIHSTTHSLPSTQDFKKETSPPDPVSLFFAKEEASSPVVITPGKRQWEEDEENASPSDHLYKARKIDISHLEISQDCKAEILNCLKEALSRSQEREAVRKKLRSLQDYLHSSPGTEDMKTIYHYYALAKTWGLSNDFFYFIGDNAGNNQEDPEEAEPA